MSIKFEKPAEAIVAIASVLIAADKVGSLTERDFLFDHLREIDLFSGYDKSKFSSLLGDVTGKVWDSLPFENHSLTPAGFETLVVAVDAALPQKYKAEAYKMAWGLISCDGVCDEEMQLLEKIRQGLKIDPKIARSLQGE